MNNSPRNSKSLYHWSRQLHLYLGIAVSPLLLIFAITTILLNHGMTPSPVIQNTTVTLALDDTLEGPALVESVLEQLDLTGEVVGRGQVRNGRTMIRVARPGNAKIINVDVGKQEAVISDRAFGLMDTLRYLHLNPGPHKSPSWIFSKMWGWVADSTVYITLLLTLTGIYLWTVLKSERRAGLIALGTGAFCFVAILYSLLAL